MNIFTDTLDFHRSMLCDSERTESFRRAIAETVQAGDVVLDIGTGTGILALFACQAGASRVYAVEAGDIVHVAKALAKRNNLSDQIEFINAQSTKITLPEKADLLITETLGNFGLDEGILEWVADARRRLLKEDARIIPETVTAYLAPIECSDIYRQTVGWTGDDLYMNLEPLRSFAANNRYLKRLDNCTLLADGESLGEIDLAGPDLLPFSASVDFQAAVSGTLHGLGGWFSSRLAPGVEISNRIPNQVPSWAHAFFPVEEPLGLKRGDNLEVSIGTRGEGLYWDWRITHRTEGGGNGTTSRQSTFYGEPQDPEMLRRGSPGRRPGISARGSAARLVISLFGTGVSLGEIAEKLTVEFPQLFIDAAQAQPFVSSLALKYSD